ncbi:MAG: HNH endonuclease [Phycisphaerales bacterium]|nr:HNH endonuclease [Phycisphaerales bacterium]
MAYSDEDLSWIYDRTSGYCHLCSKKLAFTNYGVPGARGAWEVEHSVPRACGGTERLNNLYAACVACNRSKQARSTRSCRNENGRSRAPLNRRARKVARAGNTVAGAGLGAFVGSLFGPVGAIAGGLIGAGLGHRENPDG